MPAEIDDLCQTSQLAAKVAWGNLPPVVVGAGIESLCRARNQADAALLGAVRSFSGRGEHRGEGHASVVGWLQFHCGLRKRTASRVARLSRFVDQLPPVAAALADGVISFDHVEAIADAYRERHHDAWLEGAPLLIDYVADGGRFEDFARHAQRFADLLSPTDADDRFEQQVAGRSFTKTTTIDGFGYLRGWLDPITYAIFAAEHNRLVTLEFNTDWAAARDILGRDPDAKELAELTRTTDQRSADALRVMAERSKTLAGGAVAAAADVVIHCQDRSFITALCRLLGHDDLAPDPTDGFCETDDGTVISPVAALYLSLLGNLRRVVFDTNGEILAYSRSKRLFTPAQAAAIRAKFRRCAHPYGCDRTGPLLQTDHITEWHNGGPTDIANAQPLCAFHNRWKTNNHNRPPPARPDTGQTRAPPPNLC